MTPGRRRGMLILALAAVAGIVAGTAGVYVRGSGDSNSATVAVLCADAVAAATRVAPHATGEVAAFRVATAPEDFSASPSRRRTARRRRLRRYRARSCSSISGRRGACRAGPRCRRSTGCSRRWAQGFHGRDHQSRCPESGTGEGLHDGDRRFAFAALRRPDDGGVQRSQEARAGDWAANDAAGRRQGGVASGSSKGGGVGTRPSEGADPGGATAACVELGDLQRVRRFVERRRLVLLGDLDAVAALELGAGKGRGRRSGRGSPKSNRPGPGRCRR